METNFQTRLPHEDIQGITKILKTKRSYIKDGVEDEFEIGQHSINAVDWDHTYRMGKPRK